MPLPNELSVAGIEAEKIAHRAEREESSIRNCGRGPRSARIRNLIRTIIGTLPKLFAGGGIQTEDAFVARNRGQRPFAGLALERFALLAVNHEKPVIDHRRSAITALNRHTPKDGWPIGRKAVNDTGLTPNAITLRAHPLRPIVGMGK